MIGLGTIINCAAVLAGGLAGHFSGKLLRQEQQASLTVACGISVLFSAIPIFLLEGLVTLLARLISPVMTASAIAFLSLIGSILIFCVGVNLVWGKKVRVANMLPSVVVAVAAAYIPWT